MSTIRTRTPCSIKQRVANNTFDRYGRAQHKVTIKKTKCAVVWIKEQVEKTSVRADSSASRGMAEETLYECRLLFHPRESIRLGDLITVQQGDSPEIVIEAMSIDRRPDLAGRVHHIQVEGNRWDSE